MTSKLLIASIFAALLSGSGIAAAQAVDNPPGSAFQTQGIRESEGLRPVRDPYVRAARSAAAARHAHAYAHVRAVPHHAVEHRHR